MLDELAGNFARLLPTAVVRRVARMRRTVRGLGRSSASAAGKLRERAQARGVAHDLLRSGLFDAEYYGAQIGRAFESDEHAAEHYVRTGATGKYSPHPLVSVPAFPPRVVAEWRSSGAIGMIEFLWSAEGIRREWGPLFDPRGVHKNDGTLKDRQATVREWLASLGSDVVLPVSPVMGDFAVTWGQTRARAIESARDIASQVMPSTVEVRGSAEEIELGAGSDVPSSGGMVSVLVPVLGDDPRAAKSIDSVISQTYQHWEAMVGIRGDGPTVASLIERYASDPRVRLVECRRDAGQGEILARLLEGARGDWISILNPGARWRSEFLRTLVGEATEGRGRLFCHSAVVDQNGGPSTLRRTIAIETEVVDPSFDRNATLIHHRLVAQLGFDESLRDWADRDLLIRAARVEVPSGVPIALVEMSADEESPAQEFGESPHWEWVSIGRSLIDWQSLRESVHARVEGRVSISIPVFQDFRMTIAAVRALAEHSAQHDIEIIVIDNGSDPTISHTLALSLVLYPRCRVVRMARNVNFALGSNYGFALSSGEYILFLNNDTEVRSSWLSPLLDEIRNPEVRGVQPLLVYPDGTVQAAGTEFLAQDAMPIHPLQGHPAEDGRAAHGLRFGAVTAAALLMRASEIAELEGFDAIFVNGSEDVDLCLRATERFGGWFSVAPDAVVEHKESKTPGRGLRIRENRRLFFDRYQGRFPAPTRLLYEAAGFQVTHVGLDPGDFPAARPSIERRRASVREPLRWGIMSPAPGGAAGERWGDTHFIEDLRLALESNGQHVVSHRRTAHVTPACRFDDVKLGIRGMEPIFPDRSKVNVLWVISHPDEVSATELAAFDLVYAASEPWAHQIESKWGVKVRPLLQGTDATAFRPRETPGLPGMEAPVVFVGQVRPKGPRRIVMDAIAAGVDVDVWGERWENYIPRDRHKGPYFPNSELPKLYQQARVVLADHHTDMARDGFMANRLFDAVASGARVISDRVSGLDQLFGGAVRVYRSLDHLAWMVSEEGLREAFPDDEEMHAISQRIAAEHSFEARAATIIRDVSEVQSRLCPQAGEPAWS